VASSSPRWQLTQATSVGMKSPASAPAWQRWQATEACAPVSGKRVRACASRWSITCQAVSWWQLAQSGPSLAKCGSSWQPAQPRAAKTCTGPRSLWQRRHSALACAPRSSTPVSLPWSNVKLGRSSCHCAPRWHRLQSAGNVSCGRTGPSPAHQRCSSAPPGPCVAQASSMPTTENASPGSSRDRRGRRTGVAMSERPLHEEAEGPGAVLVPEVGAGVRGQDPRRVEREGPRREHAVLDQVVAVGGEPVEVVVPDLVEHVEAAARERAAQGDASAEVAAEPAGGRERGEVEVAVVVRRALQVDAQLQRAAVGGLVVEPAELAVEPVPLGAEQAPPRQ